MVRDVRKGSYMRRNQNCEVRLAWMNESTLPSEGDSHAMTVKKLVSVLDAFSWIPQSVALSRGL